MLPAELFQRARLRKVDRTRLTQIHQHPTYWPIRAALAPCSSRGRSGSKNFSRVGTGCGQHIILTRLLTLHCFCRRNAYFQSTSCWCFLAWHRLPFNPLLVLSPAKTSCDAQRTRCCGQAASSTWWYRAMAGPAVVFTQLAYYQVNLAASHAAGLVWSKRIGDLSFLYFLGSR